MNYALFVRNAKSCETAKRTTCKCFCGGALHGKAHDGKALADAWIKYVEAKKHLVKTPEPTP